MWWKVVVHHRVVVNLVTGAAIAGVLLRRSGPLLILADAVLLDPGSEPAPIDGQVVVERTKVAFIQALPAGG